MISEQERRGVLEALDRILNRGGDADDVLREVVGVLSRLYTFVAINFLERGELVRGPSAGQPARTTAAFPVTFEGIRVAELEVADPSAEDVPFLERVALLASPYCLVGWDTGGEGWTP